MTNDGSAGSDDLRIIDDSQTSEEDFTITPWRVLVVDDDEDVHRTTRFALKSVTLLGRPVELIHAYSAAEARQYAASDKGIGVALVDVVMETPDAGLALVRDLRALGHRDMRVILRTGQPGYAPELSVIATYEIDDYRTKDELTQTRLLSVLTTSLRAYDQMRTIQRSRAGLELIVESAAKLHQRTNLELFSRGVLTQIATILGVKPNGCVCLDGSGQNTPGSIVSAVGQFADIVGKAPDAISSPLIRSLMDEARRRIGPVQQEGFLGLHFTADTGQSLTVVLETDGALATEGLALLRLFSTNISIGFENLALVERLDRLAYIDPYVDVPNLNAFEKALRSALQGDPSDMRLAVVTLDSFQFLVAAYGLRVVHQYLMAVHAALRREGGEDLVIARVADGTFALLGPRQALPDTLIPFVFAKSLSVSGIEIASTATATLLDLADMPNDATAILRNASSALLQAQRTSPGKCVTFDRAAQSEVDRRLKLQVGLRQALDTKTGLSIHLQPQIDLASGKVIAAEALIRWNRDGEQVSPAEFIPIAESSGQTLAITDFVVHAVGRWAKARTTRVPVPVAINLSMIDLNTPEFARRLLDQVADAGLTPATVTFEVTEGIAMQNKPWAVKQVESLKKAGFEIALDDFGTGYSSLAHIDCLPVDVLKIDRAFISTLTVPNARHSLAAVILSMSQALGMNCVAEGVETAEQMQALRFLGCPVGQGFYWGRPVTAERFEATYMS